MTTSNSKNRIFTQLSIIVLFLSISGCSKMVECPKSGGFLNYVGYDSTQIDTIIIYHYANETNYANFIDSIIVTKSTGYYEYSGDTCKISFAPKDVKYVMGLDNPQNEVYDLKVFNAYDKKTVVLKDFKFTINHKRNGLFEHTNYCESPIYSFNQDGTIITGTNNVYITK